MSCEMSWCYTQTWSEFVATFAVVFTNSDPLDFFGVVYFHIQIKKADTYPFSLACMAPAPQRVMFSCAPLLLRCHLLDSQLYFLCSLSLSLSLLCRLPSDLPPTPMPLLHLGAPPSAQSSTSAPEVNGLQEPSLAKRLRGTPERIELENYRLSLQREEELEEVPEETLAEHNLSSVLDKATDADLGSR